MVLPLQILDISRVETYSFNMTERILDKKLSRRQLLRLPQTLVTEEANLIARPIYPNELKALRRRWTTSPDGIPRNLYLDERALITNGRVHIDNDVEIQLQGGPGATLRITKETGQTVHYGLHKQRGRLRLGLDSLTRNIGEGFSKLGSWVNKKASIPDYMRY
jgi:hypothetical protein